MLRDSSGWRSLQSFQIALQGRAGTADVGGATFSQRAGGTDGPHVPETTVSVTFQSQGVKTVQGGCWRNTGRQHKTVLESHLANACCVGCWGQGWGSRLAHACCVGCWGQGGQAGVSHNLPRSSQPNRKCREAAIFKRGCGLCDTQITNDESIYKAPQEERKAAPLSKAWTGVCGKSGKKPRGWRLPWKGSRELVSGLGGEGPLERDSEQGK